MSVGNTAKSNGRGSKATGQRSRATRTQKVEETALSPDEPTVEVASAVSSLDAQPTDAQPDGAPLELPVVEQSVKEDVMSEPTMSTDEVVKLSAHPARSEEGAIALSQPSLMVWNRPVMPADIEVAETMSVAGVRPIAVSHLELAGSFLNGRPIEASALKVHHMLPGDRPIFDSEFKMVDGALLPGNRPIMASSPSLLAASMLPGNRPIASNEIVDPEPAVLMGYLD